MCRRIDTDEESRFANVNGLDLYGGDTQLSQVIVSRIVKCGGAGRVVLVTWWDDDHHALPRAG